MMYIINYHIDDITSCDIGWINVNEKLSAFVGIVGQFTVTFIGGYFTIVEMEYSERNILEFCKYLRRVLPFRKELIDQVLQTIFNATNDILGLNQEEATLFSKENNMKSIISDDGYIIGFE